MIGENPSYEISGKTWQAFCRRTGADYRLLQPPQDYNLRIPDIYWAKWIALRSLFEELEPGRYDRIIVADSDTFCLWTCDANFAGRRGDPVGGVVEIECDTRFIENDMKKASAVLGSSTLKAQDQMNAGLIVLDDTHVDFLDELLSHQQAANKGEFYEQTVINHLLHERGRQEIPVRYNLTWPQARKTMIDGSYVTEMSIIHCTGPNKSWMMRLWYRHHDHYLGGSP
jgi:lipopolysaccharide biosynthesis glycosyltransferase